LLICGNKNCMICLSKNGNDEFINAFAFGAGFQIAQEVDIDTEEPILFRSIVKKDLINHRLGKGLPFYYMDSGYFGNYKSPINPEAKKLWHRIVKNGLQHSDIIERPGDRFKMLGLSVKKHTKRKGGAVLLALPSPKPCKFYDIDLEKWTADTIAEIRKHTDREIIIREKPKLRAERVNNSIYEDFKKAHVLVTYNSIAAVESILHGIPAITLAPTAADPVSDKELSKVEDPTIHHIDKLTAWAHHLAYGQFHIQEMMSGHAWRMLKHED
jgi:hypothetical protein